VRQLGKNPNPFITNFLCRIVFFSHISSRVFPPSILQWRMLVVRTWTPMFKWRSEVTAALAAVRTNRKTPLRCPRRPHL
jgi:hypothetical protein